MSFRSGDGGGEIRLLIFVEPRFDQRHHGIQGRFGIGALGLHIYLAPRAGRQHHQTHDGAARNLHILPRYGNFGVKSFQALDKFSRSAGMQSALIGDGGSALDYSGHWIQSKYG